MTRLNSRTTLNTLSTGDLTTMALLLLVMTERKILERNLLGVLLLGTIGEGLNLNEWFRSRSSGVSYLIHVVPYSRFLLLSSSLSISICRANNNALSRVSISLCRFGF